VANNSKLRFSDKSYAGIWHCNILRLSIDEALFSRPSSVPWKSQPQTPMTALRIVIGEEGIHGYTSELQVPWSIGCDAFFALQ
jgi:hypothetical protein